MAVIPSIPTRSVATSALLNTIRDPLAGEPGTEIRIYHNHASERALDLRNTGAGAILRVRNAAGTALLEVTQTGVTLTGATLTGVTLNNPTIDHPTIVGATDTGSILTDAALNNPTINNATLNSVDDGTFASPGINWGASQGFYRPAANRLALASGNSTELIYFGSGDTGGGMIRVLQGQTADNVSTTLTKGGVVAGQGDFGGTAATAAMVDNRELAPLFAYAVVDSGDGLGTHRTASFFHHIMKGKGGLHKGIDVQVIGKDLWTTGKTSENSQIIAGAFMAQSEPLVNTHSSPVTGLLVTAQGENNSDLVQGMEIVLSTRTDAVTTPGQRIGIIISTRDGYRSNRGTAIDTLIMFGRKAASAGDFTNVKPWLNGIILGDYAGDIEAWPFMNDSTLIHSDPNLAGGANNIIGDVINMENTRVNGSIVKVKDSSGNVELDILGYGWIGIGMTPTHPLTIYDDSVSAGMKLRGSSFLTSSGLGIPANATRWFQIAYWDGSSYQVGKIPIF